MLAVEGFRFGIEHEFAVVDGDGVFRDFANTTFEELNRVVDELPLIASDYPGLRVGDLGIKQKRWYVEGFERFSEEGEYLRTDPKGFEIRTPICASLEEAVRMLEADVGRWESAAQRYGYRRARTALNPFRAEYVPTPALNAWEVADRRTPEEQTAHIHMLTYGPDISLSHPALTTPRTIDIGMKLTYYSPYVVPFSFSSPFYLGELWGGYSRRTYYRTGARPAALVFVGHEREIRPSFPTLTDRARLPAEVGRIEFKAFDCVSGVADFRALGTLLLGIVLDRTLPGRSLVPDESLHKRSATLGFDAADVREGAEAVLRAATEALPAEMRPALDPLAEMVQERRTPAHAMIEEYRATGEIVAAIV